MDRTKEGSVSDDEPERRLKKVMDKLYHFPNPKTSPSPSRRASALSIAMESSRRAELSTRFEMEKVYRVPHVSAMRPAPSYRPWDRCDHRLCNCCRR